MSEKVEAVFLGMNEAGEKVYDWLNQREDVKVKALLTEKEQLSLIKQLEPEVVISSGFKYKVPEDILEAPEKGVVNLHPSYLPYNRGAYPYIWPILNDTPAGVSIHYMNGEIDEGPVIDKREVRVEPSDTAEDLHNRLSFEQYEIFKKNWKDIKQGVDGREQNLTRGKTFTGKDLESMKHIDLEEEREVGEVIDLLRGLSYGSRDLGYFERNGERYFVNLDITKE